MIPSTGIGIGISLIGEVSTLASNSIAALGALGPVEVAAALSAFVYGTLAVVVVRNLRSRVESAFPSEPPAAEHPVFKRAA